MDEPKQLAIPMVFSVYPQEREAIQKLMVQHRLKSTFDVVRLMAGKRRGFFPPKKKS